MKHILNKISLKLLLIVKSLYQFVFPYKKNNIPVIFVAGVQRSGTNMIMNVLERSFDTEVFHERDKRAFDNYEMRELSVIKKLYLHSRAKHFVIKSLCELQDLSVLLREFPEFKIVIAVSYESLVQNPEVEFKRIFTFTNLKYTTRVSKKVHARSISKRRPHTIEHIVRKHCDTLYIQFLSIIDEKRYRFLMFTVTGYVIQ